MKIIINRNTPDSRQSAVVEIDTKYCHYPYAIREAIELALKLDGYDERTIDDVFYKQRVDVGQEKGCVDCIEPESDTDDMNWLN
jgi:hypothetical protein